MASGYSGATSYPLIFKLVFWQARRKLLRGQGIKSRSVSIPQPSGRDLHGYGTFKLLGSLQFCSGCLESFSSWFQSLDKSKNSKVAGKGTTVALFGNSSSENNTKRRVWTNVLIGLNVLWVIGAISLFLCSIYFYINEVLVDEITCDCLWDWIPQNLRYKLSDSSCRMFAAQEVSHGKLLLLGAKVITCALCLISKKNSKPGDSTIVTLFCTLKYSFYHL